MGTRSSEPIRVAAVGDLHVGTDQDADRVALELAPCADEADVLLLAGDLTSHGRPEQARAVANALAYIPLPKVAVLGNHDYDADQADVVRAIVEEADVKVLEGEPTVVGVNGRRLGVAGAKGFGGGFRGVSASDFGEPEMKAFIRHTRTIAGLLELALANLDADRRVALLHYAPIRDTLVGERPEIHAFLGSYLLEEAIDGAGAELVLHGHAHLGSERGATAAGVEVRNVARSVIDEAYAIVTV